MHAKCREAYLKAKVAPGSTIDQHLVWLLGPDGKVFSAVVYGADMGRDVLGPGGGFAGSLCGLEWWPFNCDHT